MTVIVYHVCYNKINNLTFARSGQNLSGYTQCWVGRGYCFLICV